MNRKIITKMLATLLAFTMTFANVALLGIYAGEIYASSVELEGQNKEVDNANIEFDAYFLEDGVSKHSKVVNLEEGKDTLYLSLKVEEGYLTNALVKIENANFKLIQGDETLELVQSIDVENSTITLNQINKGESVILQIPIEMNTDSNFDVENLNKIAKVTLEGTFVNNKAKEIKVSKTIELNVKLTANAVANLTQDVSKYVTFDVNGNKGVILQTLIKSNIVGNIIPVKQTEIEIEIPKINNVEPNTVTIASTSTSATNGEGEKTFTSEDYTYENGKIKLIIENKQTENNMVSWEKDSQDEIMITCIYGENAIIDETDIQLIANSEITTYDSEPETVTANVNQTVTLSEQIGDIVSFDIYTDKTQLHKGYMLVQNADVTSYVDTWSVNIGYKELVDNITLENKTSYVDENQNEYTSTQKYTYTKISQSNFTEILGQDGYINIYDENGDKITTLNKDNLEYKYEQEINYIKLETSKPISEGILKIENGREIKALEYSKAQEELFTKMKTTIIGKVIQNKQEIINGSKSSEIVLENPTAQASLNISNQNISTIVTTEDVEIRVTLKTTDASTLLYKNPTLELVFPTYITNLSADNVRLLYEEELKIANAEMYKNENGNIVVKITLEGEQTSFNKEAVAEGATLIMKADITVDELTPSRTENVETYITNQNTDQIIKEVCPINFTAPIGMVTVNQISGFNNKDEKATSISGKTQIGEIDTEVASKIATVNMTIINNYNYNCENVVILGRTPFEGNKTIVSGNDLGSTFTAKVASMIKAQTGITDEQITVYYSANGEASQDLSDAQNGWTTDFASLTEIKSFIIVLNDFTLKMGETIAFSYDIEIPEGLTHNEDTYGIFAVYYNKQEAQVMSRLRTTSVNSISTEVAESTQVGLSTGEGPDLTVVLESDIGNEAEIEELEIITYTAKITNNSDSNARNVTLTLAIPDNASFVSEDGRYISNEAQETVQISVGDIPTKETKQVEFKLRATRFIDMSSEETGSIEEKYYDENGNEITKEEAGDIETTNELLTREYFETDEEYEEYLKNVEETNKEIQEELNNVNKINVKVTATVEGYDDKFESNEILNTIIEEKTYIKINMKLNSSYESECKENQKMIYGVSITKNATEELTNVKITCKLPDGLTFLSTTNDGVYDEDTKTVTWTFDTLSSAKYLTLECKTNELSDEVYEKEIPVVFNAKCEQSEEIFTSNTLKMKIVKEGLVVSQTSDVSDGYIIPGEKITYAITIKNLATVNTKVTLTDYLPDELEFVKFYYTQNGETVTRDQNSGNAVNIPIKLTGGETLTVYITAKAEEITVDSKEITNKVILNSSEVKDLEANILTHRLIKSDDILDSDNGEGENNGSDTLTYSVSGLAWLDENKDGKRDGQEELLKEIKVLLLDSSTNTVITETTTNQNGIYTFSEVKRGKYVIAFEYDTVNYDITTYQADGIDVSMNSDVIDMILKINGKTNTYAVTNTISVTSNTYNIDLGLVRSQIFNLELTKSVTLIQISNAKGTESYTFDKASLSKIEIPEKYLNSSVVAITYTLTIENKGTVAGYAKKIVDYMPKDLTFNSSLNPEWYQDIDGNLYSSSLANTLIEPGEKQEVTLILTKTMTNENTGLVNNSAEIYETSNDLGIPNSNSTPGNKSTLEGDYGIADVVITIKTGGIIFYGGIVLAVLAIFALRSIWNKEKGINKNIKRKEENMKMKEKIKQIIKILIITFIIIIGTLLISLKHIDAAVVSGDPLDSQNPLKGELFAEDIEANNWANIPANLFASKGISLWCIENGVYIENHMTASEAYYDALNDEDKIQSNIFTGIKATYTYETDDNNNETLKVEYEDTPVLYKYYRRSEKLGLISSHQEAYYGFEAGFDGWISSYPHVEDGAKGVYEDKPDDQNTIDLINGIIPNDFERTFGMNATFGLPGIKDTPIVQSVEYNQGRELASVDNQDALFVLTALPTYKDANGNQYPIPSEEDYLTVGQKKQGYFNVAEKQVALWETNVDISIIEYTGEKDDRNLGNIANNYEEFYNATHNDAGEDRYEDIVEVSSKTGNIIETAEGVELDGQKYKTYTYKDTLVEVDMENDCYVLGPYCVDYTVDDNTLDVQYTEDRYEIKYNSIEKITVYNQKGVDITTLGGSFKIAYSYNGEVTEENEGKITHINNSYYYGLADGAEVSGFDSRKEFYIIVYRGEMEPEEFTGFYAKIDFQYLEHIDGTLQEYNGIVYNYYYKETIGTYDQCVCEACLDDCNGGFTEGQECCANCSDNSRCYVCNVGGSLGRTEVVFNGMRPSYNNDTRTYYSGAYYYGWRWRWTTPEHLSKTIKYVFWPFTCPTYSYELVKEACFDPTQQLLAYHSDGWRYYKTYSIVLTSSWDWETPGIKLYKECSTDGEGLYGAEFEITLNIKGKDIFGNQINEIVVFNEKTGRKGYIDITTNEIKRKGVYLGTFTGDITVTFKELTPPAGHVITKEESTMTLKLEKGKITSSSGANTRTR